MARWISEACLMDRTLRLLYILLYCTCFYSAISARFAPERVTHEVCQWETFEAGCPPDSVIIVDSAWYGRRATTGRCIEQVYHDLHCFIDVLPYADRLCSGRRRCEIKLPDANLDRSPHGCPRDLKTNLEISYHCVTVQRGVATIGGLSTGSGCDQSLTLGAASSSQKFLASVVTDETGAGSSTSCPWTIRADPGQTVKLTLYDFAVWSAQDTGGYSRSQSCSTTYAVVRESTPSAGVSSRPICRGQSRDTVSFRSTDNVVNVTLARERPQVDSMPVYFLLQYEAEGCVDLVVQKDTLVERSGDSAVIKCKDSSVVAQQEVRCVDGAWTPTPTVNCSMLLAASVTTTGTNGFDFGMFALSRQGLLIVVVVGIALVVSLCIVIIGIICLCRSQPRRNRLSRRDNDLQYVPAGSSKFDPARGDLTWNELHPMLAAANKSTADYSLDGSRFGAGGSQHSTERDYATTLQMRRIGVLPQPIHRPVGYDTSTTGSCCTCPVHGPQPPPPPQQHLPGYDPAMDPSLHPQMHQFGGGGAAAADEPSSPITPTRFSSFRPRVEHIYEVPKFADGPDDSCADLDDRANALYNDLDTRAFGTVGRRVPSLAASSSRVGAASRPPDV